MPTKAVKKFLAWSYSRLHDYEECPRRAQYKHLDKLPEPGSTAMARGSAIHKLAERFETGALKKLPPELLLFKDEFSDLVKVRKHLNVEQQLAVTQTWGPTDWFGPAAWCRVVLDCCYDSPTDLTRRIVIDHKTGKVRPENVAQLDLYAPVAFAYAPANIEIVDAQLWYLDAGEMVTRTYTRAEADAQKKVWSKRVKRMLADATFKPTPGNACRWCPYTKSKRGPCPF